MVGSCAMAPETVDLNSFSGTEDEEDEERKKIEKRFQRIGTQIMNRSGRGGPFARDPLRGVLYEPEKRWEAGPARGRGDERGRRGDAGPLVPAGG